MKRKYYLRGLGFGILVTTIVFALTGKKEMVEEEIIRHAKELGYVKQEASVTPEINLDELKDKLTPKPTVSVTPEPTDEPEITPELTPEPTSEPEPTPEPTPTEVPTPMPTPTEVPAPTPEPTKAPEPTKKPDDVVKAKVTVERGMTSKQVRQRIAEAGIVKDWTDLNRYIIDGGLADYINIGTFSLSSDMSYKEIAKILTGR